MADTKISALIAATTPLAGTEVLPIVQSGVTKQVSVANLTAGRAVSADSLTLTGSPLPATSGGTGQSSYAVGDLLYASTTTALSKLADVATGNALISGGVGVAPSWGKIGLTTHISGTLPVGNGGTGTATAFTAGSVVFAGASGVFSQNNSKFFWDNTNTRLGIGTASPGRPFTIEAAATSGLNASNPSIRINDTTSGRACVIDYDSNQLLTIWNSDTGVAGADIVFRYGSGSGTEGLRLVNNGDMKLANGNFIPSTAAKGINFTANTAAAGMTSQLLNWYEEGTWTPNQGAGLTVVGTLTTAGRYVRVGKQITVMAKYTATTSVSIASANFICTNLPYEINSAGEAPMLIQNIAWTNTSYAVISGGNAVSTSAMGAVTGFEFCATYVVA